MTTMAKAVAAGTYRSLKEKIERYERAREAFDPKRFKRGGGYSPEDQAAIVKLAGLKHAPTNDDREDVSVYDFVHDKPERLDCYIDEKTNTARINAETTIARMIASHTVTSMKRF